MPNFLEETQVAVNRHGGNSNVAYVAIARYGKGNSKYIDGIGNYSRKICTWTNAKKCMNFMYINGFDVNQINASIVIVFKNGPWMRRWKNNGNEGWEYHDVHVCKIKGLPVDCINPIPLLYGTDNIEVTKFNPRHKY